MISLLRGIGVSSKCRAVFHVSKTSSGLLRALCALQLTASSSAAMSSVPPTCVYQSAKEVIMVRPRHFSFNQETAANNAFQNEPSSASSVDYRQVARTEFDGAVRRLRNAGVAVTVFEDREEPHCPDAIFPNNWFSAHQEGFVFVYPMEFPARRKERRQDIIDYLSQNGKESLRWHYIFKKQILVLNGLFMSYLGG